MPLIDTILVLFVCLFGLFQGKNIYLNHLFLNSDMSTFKYNFISITRKHNWMMNGSEHDT